MNFFSRLFKKVKTPAQLTCPRCLGKGHVDNADIIRLQQQGKWRTGACAYCNGSGNVDKEMLVKILADATINVKSDFLQAQHFIEANPELIFQSE